MKRIDGQRAERSGLEIGVSGSRAPAYQLTTQECLDIVGDAPAARRPAESPSGLKKLAGPAYRLEKLDPRHRFGEILMALGKVWSALDHAAHPNLFAFVDTLSSDDVLALLTNPAYLGLTGVSGDEAAFYAELWKPNGGVQYMRRLYKLRYLADVRGGFVFWRGDGAPAATPLSTAGAQTGMGGSGFIWVLDRWNRLYTAKSEVGQIHHSSFASGRAIRGAGEWRLHNGRVERIAGLTGHYRITMAHLMDSVRIMRDTLRINLDFATIEVYDNVVADDHGLGKRLHVPAHTFLRHDAVNLARTPVAQPVMLPHANYGLAPSVVHF